MCSQLDFGKWTKWSDANRYFIRIQSAENKETTANIGKVKERGLWILAFFVSLFLFSSVPLSNNSAKNSIARSQR